MIFSSVMSLIRLTAMSIGRFIECLVIFIILSLVACGSYPKVKIRLPGALGITSDVYLGQDMKKIRSKHQLKYDDSAISYFEKSPKNKYFDTIYYNIALGKITADLGTLKSIDLSMTYNVIDIDSTDMHPREIIRTISGTFGNNYKIMETKYSRKELSVLWVADSCYVNFVYLPFKIYKEFLQDENINNISYMLQFKYSLEEFEKEYNESIEWTRESLSLE